MTKAQEIETSPETDQCSQIKESCIDAVRTAETLIQVQDIQLEEQDMTIKSLMLSKEQLEKQNLELEQSKNAWYRSPYLYLGLGLITGAVLVK